MVISKAGLYLKESDRTFLSAQNPICKTNLTFVRNPNLI